VVSLLGCGALGPTYRARDRVLGRDVAIKEFLPWNLALRSDGIHVVAQPPRLADRFDRIRRRFVEEGERLCTAPRAPFVAHAIDLFDAHGTSCIVFDLVLGISLDRRVRSGGALSPPLVVRLLRALVEALSHLHGEDILHGDIRPANIILDMAARPTLIDFGIARGFMAASRSGGAVLRAPGYTAPELANGGTPDTASDIYALAATIYDAITGRPPPDAAGRLRTDTYRSLVSLAPAGFNSDLLAVIDRALALLPGDRPQTMRVLRALLRGKC
jgi:serine/threonine protein kinase